MTIFTLCSKALGSGLYGNQALAGVCLVGALIPIKPSPPGLTCTEGLPLVSSGWQELGKWSTPWTTLYELQGDPKAWSQEPKLPRSLGIQLNGLQRVGARRGVWSLDDSECHPWVGRVKGRCAPQICLMGVVRIWDRPLCSNMKDCFSLCWLGENLWAIFQTTTVLAIKSPLL
jgi:hypothetical protein